MTLKTTTSVAALGLLFSLSSTLADNDQEIVLFVAGGTNTDDQGQGFQDVEAIHMATETATYDCQDPMDLPTRDFMCPPSFKVKSTGQKEGDFF